MSIDYPYRTDSIAELHPDGWAEIPSTLVAVVDLAPTQHGVSISRLLHHIAGGEPETGDPYPHVVSHGGNLYVHDGHHRYVIAVIRQTKLLRVRLVDEAGVPPRGT